MSEMVFSLWLKWEHLGQSRQYIKETKIFNVLIIIILCEISSWQNLVLLALTICYCTNPKASQLFFQIENHLQRICPCGKNVIKIFYLQLLQNQYQINDWLIDLFFHDSVNTQKHVVTVSGIKNKWKQLAREFANVNEVKCTSMIKEQHLRKKLVLTFVKTMVNHISSLLIIFHISLRLMCKQTCLHNNWYIVLNTILPNTVYSVVCTQMVLNNSCDEFAKFMQSYSILCATSSPGHKSANGKWNLLWSVKSILKHISYNHTDQYLALLEMHNTPRQDVNHTLIKIVLGRNVPFVLPVISQPCGEFDFGKHHQRNTE